MDEVTTGDSSGGMGRRDFVRRSALLGGMVWAAPAISSLGPRAFGQTGQLESPVPAGDCRDGTILRFKFDVRGGTGFIACGSDPLGDDCAPRGYEDPAVPCVAPNGSGLIGVFDVDGDGTATAVISASIDTSTPGETAVTFTLQNPGTGSRLIGLAGFGEVAPGDGDDCRRINFTSTSNNQAFVMRLVDPDSEADLEIVRGLFCYVEGDSS